eukprot:scaffold27732_cov72-Skeletonema_dohrnii-CCMP3373.AAC.2
MGYSRRPHCSRSSRVTAVMVMVRSKEAHLRVSIWVPDPPGSLSLLSSLFSGLGVLIHHNTAM